MGQLTDNSNDRDALKKAIEELESAGISAVKPSLPETKLDEMSYTAPTDAELAAQAESSLADYRSGQIDAIKSASAEKESALSAQRDGYASAQKSDVEAVGAAYEQAAKNIDDDVLKRGIARSSIAANQKGALEGEYAAKVAEIQSAYGKRIADIDSELSSLGQKLNAALNDFNLSYAAKLNDKIAELKAEREDKINEVVKYNNSVKEKQADLDAQKAKTESDLYTAALNQAKKAADISSLPESQREALYKSIYEKMEGFLSSLSAEEAKLEIRNHTLYRKHLSDYYYYKLYDKYGR